ncbi:hypothetical protein ACXYMX_04445 [Sporosarcina sp. CAU 1771]
MLLLNGVTGFHDPRTRFPKSIDGKQFKHLCYALILSNKGKILDFTEPIYPSNFYNVKVDVFGRIFHVLLNKHYPFLAFASNIEEQFIQFIDEPFLAQEFSPHYQIIENEKLNQPLQINPSKKHPLLIDNELNSFELSQIAYWKPQNIG